MRLPLLVNLYPKSTEGRGAIIVDADNVGVAWCPWIQDAELIVKALTAYVEARGE